MLGGAEVSISHCWFSSLPHYIYYDNIIHIITIFYIPSGVSVAVPPLSAREGRAAQHPWGSLHTGVRGPSAARRQPLDCLVWASGKFVL